MLISRLQKHSANVFRTMEFCYNVLHELHLIAGCMLPLISDPEIQLIIPNKMYIFFAILRFPTTLKISSIEKVGLNHLPHYS